MPFRRRKTYRPRKRRPYAAKRTGFRKRRTGFRRRGPPIMRSAFPSNRVVKMRYVSTFSLDPSAVTPFTSWYFRANSIFDPDFTGVGHEPMGTNQWSQFYNRYTVIGSKISVMAQATNTNPVATIYGARTLDSGSTIYTNIEGLIENPTTKYRLIQNITNGNIPRPVKATYSAKKWFNLASVKDNQSTVGALFGSNPTLTTYFEVFAGAINFTAFPDLPSLNFIATINFSVLFSDPKELAQS